MKQDVVDCLKWILINSDAPPSIREKALETYSNKASGTSIGQITVSPEVFKECLQHCESNMKIQAIKSLRKATSCGLKEAKDAIESQFWALFNLGRSF